jgi:hypothetical protein
MRHRMILTTVLTTAAVGCFAAVVVPAADAGQWMQVSCENPDQSPAPNEGWSGSAGGGIEDGSNNSVNCAPGSPMFALLSTAAAAPVGAGETIQYTPPAGSTLTGGTINVTLAADGWGQDASGTAVLYTPNYAYDASDVFFQCAAQLTPCANGTNDFTGNLTLPAGRGGDLYLSASCGGTAGQYCNAGGSNGAWSLVQLWWADLLLTNTSSPAATGFGGSLLSPGAHGTAGLAFTATDPNGPGVYTITIDIDGNPAYHGTANTNQGLCAPVATDPTTGTLMFDSQQPCPQTETEDIPIDTTTLADGQHDLKVIVTDAAQNSSTVLDQTITTQNSTTVSGLLPSPSATSAVPAYSLALSATTKRVTHGASRIYPRSALRLSGTVQKPGGTNAPGVPVSLWAQPASGGAFREIAHTMTDASGTWRLTAPRGPSRTIRIVAGTDARAARAAREIGFRETVMPVLTLHVATPGRGRIVFTGELEIGPLSHPLPLVLLQTRGPDGWEVVGSPVRAESTGHFRYVYRSSPLTLGRSFQFRATTPQTADWQDASSPVESAVVH